MTPEQLVARIHELEDQAAELRRRAELSRKTAATLAAENIALADEVKRLRGLVGGET